MIEHLAEKMAIFIRKQNDGIVSVSVMKFALTIILDLVCIISIVLGIGLVTHKVEDAFLALSGFALLRFFSGGIHVKSSLNCVIISVTLLSVIIFFPFPDEYSTTFQIISTLLVIIFAPSHIENHIRIKKNHVPILRLVSIGIIISNFYLDSSILTKCFFVQSLSLIEIKKKGV
jgi:accessory gene regulator B